MENQLHLQKKSNDWKDKVRENLNFISVGIMIIANIMLSMLEVQSDGVTVNLPQGLFAWSLWLGQIFMTTFVGVMILNFFRRQGIKNGHENIKTEYQEYMAMLKDNTKEQKPRSKKEYLAKEGLKDTISKATIFTLTSFLVGSLLISANFNGILSLLINTVMSIGFGIKTMLTAQEFVIEELVIWYKQKTKELKENKENERTE